MAPRHIERHRTDRIGWLRAAALGAHDGIVSTASLVLGVAAAHASHGSIMVAGTAGLVAGAMSMAAGECVSVRSQADTEEAALDMERAELQADDQGEHRELTARSTWAAASNPCSHDRLPSNSWRTMRSARMPATNWASPRR